MANVAASLQSIKTPVGGATAAILACAQDLKWDSLPSDVQHATKRHLLDTIGVMIAGAGGSVASRAEAVLSSLRPSGGIAVPGRERRADLLDAAFLGGTAAHGIELDDGYRQGSVHPGSVVIPAVLAVSQQMHADGKALLASVVAGYETAIALARACHPELRRRGFHPTPVVGVFGAAIAVGLLRGLTHDKLGNALGIAASSSGGLFAFVNGGADIKRLHAGHASREGLQAALLAEAGVEGPPDIVEARDGFAQAFVFGESGLARPVELPPVSGFGITDCYVKPYPCCRHIQPAIEALIALLEAEHIAPDEIERIDVETYRIAAEHAHTGWDDFASAQLSFPYLIGLALKFRAIDLAHFELAVRGDPAFGDVARRLHVSAPPEIDSLYPRLRPARVTVTTRRGTFTRRADEALGSREVPFGDAQLMSKFRKLVGPILGGTRANFVLEALWTIDQCDDVTPMVALTAKASA